jgi:hypothetical protein
MSVSRPPSRTPAPSASRVRTRGVDASDDIAQRLDLPVSLQHLVLVLVEARVDEPLVFGGDTVGAPALRLG